ncbi:unnamed protein product, partial [Oncorhynchus mykiss]
MALTVNLIGPSPWGFRIYGGRDFKKAITISKVIANDLTASLSHPILCKAKHGMPTPLPQSLLYFSAPLIVYLHWLLSTCFLDYYWNEGYIRRKPGGVVCVAECQTIVKQQEEGAVEGRTLAYRSPLKKNQKIQGRLHATATLKPRADCSLPATATLKPRADCSLPATATLKLRQTAPACHSHSET